MLRKNLKLLFLLSAFFFFTSLSLQAQITSENDGNWNSPGTWQGSLVPTASDDVNIDDATNPKNTLTVTIQSGTTVEANDLEIGQYGKLIVEGTLIVYGNLTMVNNDPELIAGSDATIIIHGNASISNKVNISLSSYFVVLGNFEIDGGGNTDIDISDASLYVFGTFDGGSTNLTSCEEYDNNTEDYNPDSCHIGTDSAFYNNKENGLIPHEIVDLVDPCDASAIIFRDATICDGELATLTVDFTGTSPWNITTQRDGGDDLTVINIDVNPYTFDVSKPGVYTISAVSDANCTGTASGSATVTVNQLNLVVSDITPEPSGNHCPEFLPPFDANTTSYNPGVTEVIFKVEKNLSSSTSWTFDFQVDETGDVEVYDLEVSGNNSAITYAGDDAGGSIDAGDNTELTFTFQIWNVPGTALDVDFSVSNGNDGNCNETGTLTDNNKIHTINVMPVVGSFNP